MLHLHLVAGQGQEGPGGEFALGGGLEQLAPGIHGLFVGLGCVGAFAAPVQPLGQVALLGKGRDLDQGRQGAKQGDRGA